MCLGGGGRSNYDSVAIEMVGNEVIKNAQDQNKLMIVLSDGQPAGYEYGGQAAINATRLEVEALEKKGVAMFQIAIDAACPELMFKNYVRFTDMDSMIPEMSKMLQKLIFGSGREFV